ncbi:MAG: DUF1822 family protein [Halothece sp. Uz-M2-17]|nr:DUF1822 family protein [Halothece sp. Uz-M2-17]
MGKFREKTGLEGARQIQQDWLEHGLDFVDLYIDDVEGDWLETWGEETTASESSQVNTRQWLEGVFEQGWRTLESLFNDYQLSAVPAMTRELETEGEPVKAAKPLHFDATPIPKVFALLVVRLPLEDGRVRTEIKLHSMGKKGILPQGVELRALDENDELIQNPIIAGEQDSLIQLQGITAPIGTPFKVQVIFQEIVKTEQFSL